MVGEFGHLARHDGLNIAVAVEGLRHLGGIDIELDRGRAAGEKVALEVGGNVERG